MEISIDGPFLRKLISCIKDFTECSNVIFSKSGFDIQAMDNAHVSIVSVKLFPSFFNKYTIKKDLCLGIKFETLHKIIKVNKSNDIILSCKDTDEMNIDMLDGHSSFNFCMKLMDIENNTLNLHELDYQYIVKMNAQKFYSIIKELSYFGSECTIQCKPESFSLIVNGDMGSGRTVIEDVEITSFSQDMNLKLNFNFKYIISIASSVLSDVLILKFGENIPLCCEYPINDGNIVFFLAPKIQDDTEEMEEDYS